MLLALASLFVAIIITFGRQSAVFGKMEKSLWFFSNYEAKRIWFSLISISVGLLALYLYPISSAIIAVLALALLCLFLSFLFDFKYIFPEVKKVERELGKLLDIMPNTEVIGVFTNDITVAYPLSVLIPRHIINDKILDLNIVAAYCAICRSGLVFKSEIDGESLYFTVSGVWRRNMIMIDKQTNSLWQQATGECIYGKYKGRNLELLSGENTRWKAWVEKHPESEFAYKCIEARRGYLSRQAMIKGLNFITPKVTPPGFTDLEGLAIRETVFGIDHNGISKAYPKSEIEELTGFSDYLNSEKIELDYNKSGDYLTAVSTETKKQIIVEKHWWLGWKEFHPETEIWRNHK